MSLEPHEVDAVLLEFASTVKQSNQLWGLKGKEGWAVCESIEFEETDVLPFFSSEESALCLCSGEWASYQPESLSLEEFLEDWLPGMHEDQVMVGLQWDDELEGAEIEPAEVATALS